MRSRADTVLTCVRGLMLLAAAGLAHAACSSEDPDTEQVQGAVCGTDQALTYENFGGPFVLNWCTGCHSSNLPEEARQESPEDVNFDSLEEIRAWSERMVLRAGHERDMPPAGGPTREQRELFVQWLECGAPGQGDGFVPPPVPDAGPPPDGGGGACREAPVGLPNELLPRCSFETYTCVTNCAIELPEEEVDSCRDACLSADTTEAATQDGRTFRCNDCVFNELLACASQSGCAPQVADFQCCLDDCLQQPDPGTCFETKCNDSLDAFGYCAYFTAEHCVNYSGDVIGACFDRGPESG